MTNPKAQPIARVELVITGETLNPADITTALAMHPTRSFVKGEVASKSNAARKRPWGLWALQFEGMKVQDVAVHLLESLRGKEGALKTIANTMEVNVSIAIWWEPPEGQGGYTLSSATLAQLCGLSSQIHFYLPG
jgi:hypothetical protein